MKIKTSSVAIVILSWNDSKNTIECLKSVFKNDYLNFDVVLVDNNSTEGHFNKVLSWCKSQRINFYLINSKIKSFTKKNKNLFIFRINEVANFPFAKNLGVARGYNKGFNFVLKKNYDFFIRLDCDFIVPKNYITGLVKTFVKNKSAVAVSPKVYYHIKKNSP